jgi:hypothetical protein
MCQATAVSSSDPLLKATETNYNLLHSRWQTYAVCLKPNSKRFPFLLNDTKYDKCKRCTILLSMQAAHVCVTSVTAEPQQTLPFLTLVHFFSSDNQQTLILIVTDILKHLSCLFPQQK